MDSDKAILAVGAGTRLVEPMIKGLTSQTLFFSYGEIVPDLSAYNTSFWMGGLYAAQLQDIGLAQNLCSPGADWLPQLDESITGRTIYSGTAADLDVSNPQTLWVKPSEAKLRSLPAAAYTASEVIGIFEEHNLNKSLSLQWTDSILHMDYEHRFFIAEGKVISGSPYKVNGTVYNAKTECPETINAINFAQFVLDSYSQDMPPAFVMDVALNMDTGRWLVIEANRAWSSGFYATNPTAALEVIEYSSQYAGEKWQWQPDAQLTQIMRQLDSLTILPVDAETIGFFEFNKK